MRTPEELATAFREQGLKITPQRQAVFRALHGSGEHPTAEAVHAAVAEEMPMVSLRTVYQVLNDLTAMGEITALDLGTGSTRFDPTHEEHHHLVCTSCGAVRDLYLDDLAVELPAGQAAGYRVGRPEITFRGVCPACRQAPTGARAGDHRATRHRSTSTTQHRTTQQRKATNG